MNRCCVVRIGCREIAIPLIPFVLEIEDFVVECRRKLVPPGELLVLAKEEIGMDDLGMRFKLAFPAPANPGDVGRREIVASVDGESRAFEVDKSAAEGFIPPRDAVGARGFYDGQTVEFKVVDYDAKGNPTPGPVLSITVVDDIGPAAPGMLGVLVKEQIYASDWSDEAGGDEAGGGEGDEDGPGEEEDTGEIE